ncbi:MAG: hypothetical protein A2268_12010 [Candidatus Raymondbacteria bacterium RifOxyA12_full_50_37]|uniref:Secretion system C-terminal sorting domain-containing protein n=1 Tax=Candidatus Raymondbacteria bacterium RIFOXYD12_FULL_49_13 TaxID=1817890 RepID=A0A1F7F0X2_UNCRA|nr:MAG: hypothetical protein A2268_12010 [Candidatus Raymondbacteria bacterium RifOxyA12_full_50_37]OGJ86042.1 MAG: hypothetical protein A2248_02005 [Candidatus Raymondbacteria bacterium RIFOXYA2_FULL_49_16]OGJ95939.1 MAG: hypothetical protein A2453_05410 [Candidatus Raymondbacteria bacterium RIFOXYC2_FULL_50_21]OGJ98351.1 MAG: hypothetical protein A2350_11370 [Candidatus Raymondbacteria bacterium RifOxyB12_full_50_8]OGK00187.1 MAG: hypothetical protein A2519_20460 [Candidatus Raymondbacteria b
MFKKASFLILVFASFIFSYPYQLICTINDSSSGQPLDSVQACIRYFFMPTDMASFDTLLALARTNNLGKCTVTVQRCFPDNMYGEYGNPRVEFYKPGFISKIYSPGYNYPDSVTIDSINFNMQRLDTNNLCTLSGNIQNRDATNLTNGVVFAIASLQIPTNMVVLANFYNGTVDSAGAINLTAPCGIFYTFEFSFSHSDPNSYGYVYNSQFVLARDTVVSFFQESPWTIEATRSPVRDTLLFTCSPNPFNPATKLSFFSPILQRYTIDFFNCNGKRIQSLSQRTCFAGLNNLEWPTDNIPSGMYYIRLSFQSNYKTIRGTVLK